MAGAPTLWRHPDFLKFWAAQSISVFGSQFSHLALPLIAALALRGSPGEMGILQGRMNATMRFLVWGTMPLGGLVGGAIGEVVGLRGAMIILAGGGVSAFLWIALSPVPALRAIPELS